MRMLAVILGSASLLIFIFATLAMSFGFQVRAASDALDEAGYGEHALGWHFWWSHCPLGQTTFTFIAQGGRKAKPSGLENTGYVCVSYFSKSSVHEVPVDPAELPDWEP